MDKQTVVLPNYGTLLNDCGLYTQQNTIQLLKINDSYEYQIHKYHAYVININITYVTLRKNVKCNSTKYV